MGKDGLSRAIFIRNRLNWFKSQKKNYLSQDYLNVHTDLWYDNMQGSVFVCGILNHVLSLLAYYDWTNFIFTAIDASTILS